MSKISEKNPLGLLAVDHLEFTANELTGHIAEEFSNMGFKRTEENPKEGTTVYSQGQIRFLLTHHPDSHSHSRKYLETHGEGVSKMSFLVEDCEHAIKEAQRRGAKIAADLKVEENTNGVFKTAMIRGFGDVLNEFVERPKNQFRPGYTQIDNDPSFKALNTRLSRIDHFTNNVPFGEMEKWVQFYKDIYGFVETRYFDIKGSKTGLNSKVVQLEDNSIIIPINQPKEAGAKDQIQEFVERHNGPGVQHIALMTPDEIDTVSELRSRGFKFLNIPHTYYEEIPNRPFKVQEDIKTLEDNQLLVDGDENGYLLQIFTDTYIGPLFYEIIQRKNHWGFGEGNFHALFEAIERDQVKRGYLKE